jgi:nitrite reductase/ring-hydroxylating ferredoxin subunit
MDALGTGSQASPAPPEAAPRETALGPRCTRRSALAALGAGGLALGVTACSSGSGGAEPAATSSSAPGGVPKASIPVGGGTVVASAQAVVTQPTAGVFKAFASTCTHAACTVTGVSGGTINCPCHGSQFDIATGAVVTGPATRPLAAKSATVTGDTIPVS